MKTKDIRFDQSTFSIDSGISSPPPRGSLCSDIRLAGAEDIARHIAEWLAKKADVIEAGKYLKGKIDEQVNLIKADRCKEVRRWGPEFDDYIKNSVEGKHSPGLLSKEVLTKVRQRLVGSSTVSCFSPWTGERRTSFGLNKLKEMMQREKGGAPRYAKEAERGFFAANLLADKYHLVKANDSTFFNPSFPHLLATPGGLCYDGDRRIVATIEIQSVAGEDNPEPPEEVEKGTKEYSQAIYQMLVLRVKTAYLCRLYRKEWRVYKLERPLESDHFYNSISTLYKEYANSVRSSFRLVRNQGSPKPKIGRRPKSKSKSKYKGDRNFAERGLLNAARFHPCWMDKRRVQRHQTNLDEAEEMSQPGIPEQGQEDGGMPTLTLDELISCRPPAQ